MIKNNVIARKTVSILTALAMIIAGLGFLVSNPQDAYADDTKTVKVNFTTSVGNAFVHAPQFNVEVNSGLAESYEYTDKVSSDTGVSALDVLVKAHELIFGKEDVKANLSISDSGWVATTLGGAFGFAVNGKAAHSDIPSSLGGYEGLMINEAALNNGDSLNFFIYQDLSGYLDKYVSFYDEQIKVSSVDMIQGEVKKLTIKGYSFAYYGTYDDDGINSASDVIEGAQIGLVNEQTGEISNIEGTISDENGSVEIVCDDAGEYYLTAYMPEKDIENGSIPVILSLIKVNVKAKSTTPTTDNTDKTTTGKTDSTETTKTETTAAKNENSPKTGDDFNAVPLIAIAICAAVVGGATLIRRNPEGK